VDGDRNEEGKKGDKNNKIDEIWIDGGGKRLERLD